MREHEEDAVYIVQNGEKTKLNPVEFGTDKITWKNGVVLDVERSERLRIKKTEQKIK